MLTLARALGMIANNCCCVISIILCIVFNVLIGEESVTFPAVSLLYCYQGCHSTLSVGWSEYSSFTLRT